MGVMYLRLPNSFLPQEDQGILITSVQLPVGATQDRTLRVLEQVTDYYLTKEKDAVEGVITTAGFGFGGQGQNVGIAFVRLKPFDERKSANLSAPAVAGRAMMAFSQIKDGQVFALAPPMVPGLGNSNGFDFYLQDVNGAGHDKLIEARNRLLAAAAQDKLLANTRPNGLEDEPQFAVDFDQEKASALGLTLSDINTTLSTAWGSDYVNDFIDRGRVKKVFLQSDQELPHAAGGPRPLVRAECVGRHGAVLRLRLRSLDLRLAAARTLQRLGRRRAAGRSRRRRQFRRRHG